MTETEQPLTSYALTRLRQLAEGNGITPETIQLKGTEEKEVILTGVTRLVPKVEVQTQRLAGRGLKLPKIEQNFQSFAELSNYIASEQQKFQESNDWFNLVKAELEKQPGKGWGLSNARVILDEKPAVHLCATEICPACAGAGNSTCTSCAGRGYTPCPTCHERGSEPCYSCYGSGRNPQDQEQPCPICSGTRFAMCRTCQGRKGIACHACGTAGTLICQTCQGGGQIVELSTLTFGADAGFAPGSSSELPAALRRGFDRAGGIKVLANGHAEIACTVPKEEDVAPNAHELRYTAKISFADLVVQFGDTPHRIAIFGLKRTLLEVPSYLDAGLTAGLELLRDVAKGKGSLERALEYRALREACDMNLAGKKPESLRQLYPVGLSKPMMQEIFQSLRRALARITVMARAIGFLAGLVLATALGGALYLTPLHQNILAAAGQRAALFSEIFLGIFTATVAYIVTGQAALFHLKQLFPKVKMAVHHHGGYLAMLGSFLAFLIPFALSFLHPTGVIWQRMLH